MASSSILVLKNSLIGGTHVFGQITQKIKTEVTKKVYNLGNQMYSVYNHKHFRIVCQVGKGNLKFPPSVSMQISAFNKHNKYVCYSNNYAIFRQSSSLHFLFLSRSSSKYSGVISPCRSHGQDIFL